MILGFSLIQLNEAKYFILVCALRIVTTKVILPVYSYTLLFVNFRDTQNPCTTHDFYILLLKNYVITGFYGIKPPLNLQLHLHVINKSIMFLVLLLYLQVFKREYLQP